MSIFFKEFPQKMGSRQISSVKSVTFSRNFTRALSQAFHEWLLIFMLFINAIISYLITKFADYSELQTPCLVCSRLDHILGNKRLKHYWDLICSKHKSEISSLVYCHSHNKLVDVHGMCETCLFSFATVNKSNAETYRLLVGKLGENSFFEDAETTRGSVPASTKYCTCCNQPWLPRSDTKELCRSISGGSETVEPSKVSSLKVSDRSNRMKKVGFNQLPHVGYTQLKLHSDTESEIAISEEEKDEDDGHHKFQTIELEPRIIALSYDSAAEKLIDSFSGYGTPVFTSGAGSIGHGLEELNWQEMKMKNGPSRNLDLIAMDDFSITTEPRKLVADVLKDNEFISNVDSPLTPVAYEPLHTMSKQEELVSVEDTPIPPTADKVDLEVPEEIGSSLPVLEAALSSSALFESMTEVSTRNCDSKSVETEEKTTTGSDAAQGTYNLPSVSTPNMTAAATEMNRSLGEQNVTETAQEPNLVSNGSSTLQVQVAARELDQSLGVTETASETNPTLNLSSTSNMTVSATVTSRSLSEQNVAETPQEPNDLSNESSTLQVQVAATELDPSLRVTETASETNPILNHSSTVQVLETASKSNPSDEQYGTETASEAKPVQNDPFSEKVSETATEASLSLKESNLIETASEANPSSCYDSSTLHVPETSGTYSSYGYDSSTLHVPETSETATEASPSLKEPKLTETASEANPSSLYDSSTLHVPETAIKTNPSPNDSSQQVTESLDLTDAYKIAVDSKAKRQSSPGLSEQWTGRDSPRISDDLKALLTQLSTSTRGVELSPRDISPKTSLNNEDMKNDALQSLLQKRIWLERNESNVSFDGVAVSEVEGESDIERLKRQVEHDKRLLNGLYKELEEERNASAVATNQAMAMITRLQEEKAMLQMEALQNLRMMEEQAEYDMQALQETNDLLAEKEKEIQDLEAELELYRAKFPDVSTAGNIVVRNQNLDQLEGIEELEEHDEVDEKLDEAEMPCKGMSDMIKTSLVGFEDERLYISECLEKLEKKLHLFSNNGIHSETDKSEYIEEGDEVRESNGLNLKDGFQENGGADEHHLKNDAGLLEEEVSELHERLETLKGDLYFLEHIINSLKHGDEGVQFIKEIASHLLTLRTIGVRRRDQVIG